MSPSYCSTNVTDGYVLVLLWLGPTEGGKSGKPKKRQGPDWNSELMEHFFPGHWDSVRNRTTNHHEVQPCIELAPPKFEPEFFSMRLQRSANDGSRASTTLITQSASSGAWLPELHLENLTDWQCLNPRLFAPYGKKRLPSNIVSGEVSLTIPSRNNLKGDTRLIIEDIFTAAGSLTGQCHARTRIYVDNEHVFTPNLQVETYGSEGRLYHQPQFGADPFWQRQIAGSMVSDQVRSRIKRIVTVQELFEMKPKDEDQVPDLLVYWTFSVAPPDTPGSTRFRRIIPPAEVMPTGRQYGDVKAGAQDMSFDSTASNVNPYGYYRDAPFEMEIDTRATEGGALLSASQGSTYALSPFDLNDHTSLQSTIGWQQSRDNPSIGQLGDCTPTVATFPLGTSAAESFPINAGLTEDSSIQLYDPDILHDAGSMPSAQYPRYGLPNSSHPSWRHAAAMLGESEYVTPGMSSQEPSQPHQAQCNTSFGAYPDMFQDKDVANAFDMPKAAWHQKPHVESLRSTQNGYFNTHYLASQTEERRNRVTNEEGFNGQQDSRSPSAAPVEAGTARSFPYYPMNDRPNLQSMHSHVSQPMVPSVRTYGMHHHRQQQQQQQQQPQPQNEQSHQKHLYPAPTLPSMPSVPSETLPSQMNLTPTQSKYFAEAQHVHPNLYKQQDRPPQPFPAEPTHNLPTQRASFEDAAPTSAASTRSAVEIPPRHPDDPQQQPRQHARHGSFESAFETPRQEAPYPSRILDYEPQHAQGYHEPQGINEAPQASLAGQQEASPQSASTPSTLTHPHVPSQHIENEPHPRHENTDTHHFEPPSAPAVAQLEFDPTPTLADDIAPTTAASPPAPQPGGEEGAQLLEENASTEFFDQRHGSEWDIGRPHLQQSPGFPTADPDVQSTSVQHPHGVSHAWGMPSQQPQGANEANPQSQRSSQAYAKMQHYRDGRDEDVSPTTTQPPGGWCYVQGGSGGEGGGWVDAWTVGGQRQHEQGGRRVD